MTLDDFAKLLEAFINARPDLTLEQKKVLVDLLAFVADSL